MKKCTFPFALIISFLFFSLEARSQISEAVKENIQQKVASGKNVGIVVGLLKDGQEIYFSYGKTALNGGLELDKNTVFEIGSISKVFTTILLADQVLKGTMALDDPVEKYLPENAKIPEYNGKKITLKNLATHTSALPGMPDNFKPADPNNPFADYSVAQLYSFLSAYELKRAIGKNYEYSNLGMGLLGHILELHLGKTYEELVIANFADSYDMADTKRTLTPSMKERLAKGHAYGQEVANWDIITLAGAGGLRSTASDMLQFMRANLNGKKSPLMAAMRYTHNPAFASSDGTFQMGLGWHFANSGSIVWHNGGTGGYKTFTGFHKESNTGVVVLANSIESVDDIGLHLLDSSNKLVTPTKKEPIKEVEVAVEILETYIGTYAFSPDFAIEITRDEKQLYAQATGQQKFPIFASAENTFFLKVVEANVVFEKDEEGMVNRLTLNQNGQSPKAKKVN